MNDKEHIQASIVKNRLRSIQAKYYELPYGTKVGVLAFLGAQLTMFAFTTSEHYSLPSTDWHTQGNLFCAIFNPFLLTFAIPTAAFASVLAFPVAYVCLKKRNVWNCSVFVSVASILSIVILSIRGFSFLAIPPTLLAAIICLLLCKFLPISSFKESSRLEKKNGEA